MSKIPQKVIVLGAGLTGLGAAYKLSEAGIEVTVIEEKPRLGGIAASIKRNGYIFDYGPHRFHTKNKTLLEEMKSLMQEHLSVLYRKSMIRLMGKYFAYPLEAKNLLLNMNPLHSAYTFFDYLVTRALNKVRPRQDSSFENWIVNRFGRALYNMYFGPYTEKLWGIHPTKISPDWASQRIALINLLDVAIRLLIKRDNTPRTYQTRFYYPPYGSGQFAEQFAERITFNKGTIHTEAKVSAVVWKNNNIEEIVFEKNGGVYREKADYVISTIPITDLVLMSRPLPRGDIIESARSLKYRGTVFLFLIINKGKITDNHWIYCPEKKLFFTRLSEPRNFSDKMVISNTTSLCVEVNCNKGDEIWNAGKDEIFEKVVSSLEEIELVDRADVKDFFIDKLSHAYPVYEIGYGENIRKLISFLHSSQNLITTGRQGLFRYGNMDHAIDMGFLSAEHLLSGEGDKSGLFNIADRKDYFG